MNFNFDFELILFYACVVAGVLTLIDVLFFARRRQAVARVKIQALEKNHPYPVQDEKSRQKLEKSAADKLMPWYMDYARSFFPILIIVFVARSFLYEPFRIPSGSLEPTLLTGDFILVDKHRYGLRLPILGKVLALQQAPERGDILIFRWPADPSVYFIKRVIGVPGDQIEYRDKILYINGKEAAQNPLLMTSEEDEEPTVRVQERIEALPEGTHHIYVRPDRQSRDYSVFTVPAGMFFVMGDNRDDSADSRYFGFVPEANIVGKAVLVWMSWDSRHSKIRFERILKKIHLGDDHA